MAEDALRAAWRDGADAVPCCVEYDLVASGFRAIVLVAIREVDLSSVG